jgi:hypothetical protein
VGNECDLLSEVSPDESLLEYSRLLITNFWLSSSAIKDSPSGSVIGSKNIPTVGFLIDNYVRVRDSAQGLHPIAVGQNSLARGTDSTSCPGRE